MIETHREKRLIAYDVGDIHHPARDESSMSLRSFREHLEAKTEERATIRPFVCDGNPFDCKAFLVGINAASDVPFWCFWNDQKGFDKTGWDACYRAKRNAARRTPVSPTRERIKRIVCAAAPVKVLETNLFAVATARARDLRDTDKLPDVLEFLLCRISPTALLLHGKIVQDYFEHLCGHSLTRSFTGTAINGKPLNIAAVKHLAYVSYAKASELGESIRSLIAE